jgi:hypothetical protein
VKAISLIIRCLATLIRRREVVLFVILASLSLEP